MMIPTMQDVLDRLQDIGYPESTVRRALPSWWDIDLENDSIARLEGFGYIAEKLDIDLSTLITIGKPLKRRHLGFKKP